MELESEGLATGDPDRPFVARVTYGTRKRKSLMHEWEAASLADAEQEAEDWMYEYIARLSGHDDAMMEPAAIAARRGRLRSGMPPLPEPCELYVNAMNGKRERWDAPPAPVVPASITSVRRTATSAHIKRVVDSARRAGIDVSGVRTWPDGSIAAFDARWAGAAPAEDADR